MLYKVDEVLFEIQKKMWRKISISESERCMYPITWYINTGRAATDFLRRLINLTERQKSTIANRLIKYHGNYEECIDSICQYIGFVREK